MELPDFIVPELGQADASIAVGDGVRSYGTQFQDSSYVEGVVTAVGPVIEGCPRYQISVTRRLANGEELPAEQAPDFVYPPVDGTPYGLGGFINGVRKI